MADLTTCMIPITELCEVERARADRIYPAGTCYVTLSAAHDTVMQISEDGPIESRYAAIVPHEDVDTDYLKVVLDRAFPRWLATHRTGINLQFGELATLTVEWHDSPETQRDVVNAAKRLDELADMERRTIDGLKELKQYLLLRMFV